MSRAPTFARRLSLASRIVAAVFGGYALVSLMTIAVSLLLAAAGVNQPQALLGTTMASFLVYAAIIMAAFHARSAARAWLWLAAAALPLGVIAWLLLPGAGA